MREITNNVKIRRFKTGGKARKGRGEKKEERNKEGTLALSPGGPVALVLSTVLEAPALALRLREEIGQLGSFHAPGRCRAQIL